MSQREKIVQIATSYKGISKGSPEHHKIIDTFNKWKPDGYTAKYSDLWCAEFATACIYLADLTKLVRGSASCSVFISKAKADGIWVENDGYNPDPGDFILYDWDDSGKGNNVGSPDHIGIVVQVKGSKITVIEGNMGSPSHVGYRTININGRYIRGFIAPKYDKGVVERPKTETQTSGTSFKQKYKVLATAGMNVRAKATTSSKIVGGIPYGNTFTATKKSGDWVYSSYYKGWVCIKQGKSVYLKAVK